MEHHAGQVWTGSHIPIVAVDRYHSKARNLVDLGALLESEFDRTVQEYAVELAQGERPGRQVPDGMSIG